MKYLLGMKKENIIAGRKFTYNDVIEKKATGFGHDYYGGNVQYFGRTKEGFQLCIKKNTTEILDIYIDEGLLTVEGLKLLLKDQGKEEVTFILVPEEVPSEEEVPLVNTNETLMELGYMDLKALAKEVGVEGRLTTMKAAELREKIQSKLAEKIKE